MTHINSLPNTKQGSPLEEFVTYSQLNKLAQDNPTPEILKKKTRLRNKLVEKNIPLVYHTLKKYFSNQLDQEHNTKLAGLTVTRDDLVQEGTLGLMSAVDGFDPSLGWQFSTYAAWWIRQSIKNHITESNSLIKTPTHIRASANKLFGHMSSQIHEENMEDTAAAYSPYSALSLRDDFEERLNRSAEELGFTEKLKNSIKCSMVTANMLYVKPDADGEFANTDTSDQDETSKGVMFGNDHTLSSFDDFEPLSIRDTISGSLVSGALVDVVAESLRNMDEKRRKVLLLRFSVLSEEELDNNQNCCYNLNGDSTYSYNQDLEQKNTFGQQ